MSVPFPRLRLRQPSPELLGLPWDLPLEAWSDPALAFRDMAVGPSRHLVRFLSIDGALVALKEEPIEIAEREYEILRHLEEAGLPSVIPMGVAADQAREAAILVTRYLPSSLQYRRLLSRVPPGPGYLRDQLLDAMAGLLVDLHRGGVYWGDCSLANTLFRRDGNKVQAYLVDAETSELHPSLSDGQRAYDLEVLVENVAFGLADLAAMQERDDLADDAMAAAATVQDRYCALWDELTAEVEVGVGERYEIAARVRRLNDLGFAVAEIQLEPGNPGRVRMHAAVTNRRFHAGELERLTGLRALEGQARLLLNDLREHAAWIEHVERRSIAAEEAAARWLADVYGPAVRRIGSAIGSDGDAIQSYCDVLESKWLLSEKARRDVGLDAAIDAYLGSATQAGETRGSASVTA